MPIPIAWEAALSNCENTIVIVSKDMGVMLQLPAMSICHLVTFV